MKYKTVRVFEWDDPYKGWGRGDTVAFVMVPATLNFKQEWGKVSDVNSYLMKEGYDLYICGWEVLSESQVEKEKRKLANKKVKINKLLSQLERR